MEQYNQEKQQKMIDWSAVPEFVLLLVADKLNHPREFHRLGVVCTSWHKIYKDIRDSTLADVLREPLLLLLPDINDPSANLRILYSFNKKKVYKNLHLPVPGNEYCVGSSHGWLAMLSYDFQLRLLNPFLSVNNEIELPPFLEPEDYDTYFVHKVVISDDPLSNPNYAVMAMHGTCGFISFYSAAGNKEWTRLHSRITDVIYSDSDHKFYAFRYDTREIYAYDLNGHSSIETPTQDKSHPVRYVRYLIKSGSDMLCVTTDHTFEPKLIKVYKFDQNKREWNEVKNLDGRILFLGDNSSLTLPTADMPGCEPNCGYLTDAFHHHGCFNLEDGRVHFFYMENDASNQLCKLGNGTSFPIFIQPPRTCPFIF